MEDLLSMLNIRHTYAIIFISWGWSNERRFYGGKKNRRGNERMKSIYIAQEIRMMLHKNKDEGYRQKSWALIITLPHTSSLNLHFFVHKIGKKIHPFNDSHRTWGWNKITNSKLFHKKHVLLATKIL